MIEKEKGKRARVVDLEETATKEEYDKPVDTDSETEGEATAVLKHGKKKKIQQVYKEGKTSLEVEPNKEASDEIGPTNEALDGVRPKDKARPKNKDKSSRYRSSKSQNPTDRLITYIIDILEIKDEHELFSMPDNLETYDLGENLSVPRDFATLRQKHKDGMYQTLEQFKAKYLLDQADLIFRSLRTNPIYAEKELEAWHQKYFQYKKKAVRFEKSTAIFSVEILESRLRPRVASSMKQSSKDNEGAPSRRPQSLGTKKKTKNRSSSKPRGGRPSVNLDGKEEISTRKP
ncbi:hypothetical protein J5N97_014644 [Dioscorea zingiberensis]|uniref:Bromo domain-containing protein n=1 Tax=Dioscorea zingiberensis TaxID=325984 RepID=A0A9D5HJP9_9LILI|nr:hypothetical protein J5N97_014644 [Dioscorea zingiberensis]